MSSSSRSKPFLKRSLLSYAIAVTAAGMLAQNAMAIDICSGNSAVNVSSGQEGNDCTLDVSHGSLTITSNGVLDQTVEVRPNFVTINSAGDVSVETEDFSNGVYALYFDSDANGSLTNSGNISATQSASASGSASCSGSCSSFSREGSVSALFINGDMGGSITNAADSNIAGSAYGSVNVSGYYGSVFEDANGIEVDGNIAGELKNYGTISASAEANYIRQSSMYGSFSGVSATANANGVEANGIYGSLINAGVITADSNALAVSFYGSADAEAEATGVDVDNDEIGLLNNSNEISAQASANAYGFLASVSASAVAEGVEAGYIVELMNSGTISAEASAVAASQYGYMAQAEASASGVTAYYIDKFENDADGIVSANATTLSTNHYGNALGYANATGVNAGSFTGPYFDANDSGGIGTFINSGTIEAAATVTTDSYGSSSVSYGTAVGVNIGSIDESPYGSFINNAGGVISATVTATATAHGYGSLPPLAPICFSSCSSEQAFASGSAIGVWVGDADGAFTNKGEISASSTASANAYNNAYGTARSFATGVGLGEIDAAFTNEGAISAVSMADVSASNNGYGSTAYADADGVYVGEAYAEWTNAKNGSISASVTASAAGSDNADINAYGTATAVLIDSLYEAASNSGTISALATATAENFSSGNAHAYAAASGVRVGYLQAALSNDGTISAGATAITGAHEDHDSDAFAVAYGIDLGNVDNTYGSFANAVTGVITATADVTAASFSSSTANGYANATGVMSDFSGVLSNAGHITATASADADADYGDEGEANAYGTATGVVLGNFKDAVAAINDTDGSFTNAAVTGVIKASATGTAVASGDSSESRAYAFVSAKATGIYGSIDIGQHLINSGSIIAEATAESNSYSYANATAHAVAIGIEASTVYGELTNDGSITASATADSDDFNNWNFSYGDVAAEAYGIRVDDLGYGTSLINGKDGLIVVSALSTWDGPARAAGIYVDTVSAMPVEVLDEAPVTTIVNRGTIIASAKDDSSSAEAYGIYVDDLGYGTMIDNSGTIEVEANNGYGEAYGIYVSYGSGSVNNSGTINGGVSLGGSCVGVATFGCGAPGTVSLTNSGTINTMIDNPSYVSGDVTQTGNGVLGFQVRGKYAEPEEPTLAGIGKGTGGYAQMEIYGTLSGTNNIRMNVDIKNHLLDGDVLEDVLMIDGAMPSTIKLTDNSAFFDFTYAIEGQTIDMTANKVTAQGAVAGSGLNLSASGAELVDGLIGSAGDDDSDDLADSGVYSDLANALFNATTPEEVAAVLESVGPVMFNAQATRAVGDSANKALGNHLSDTRNASSGDAFKDGEVWIKPFFGNAEQDAANGVSGYDVDTSGFLIGVDGAVSDAMRVGVAYAGANSNVDGGNGSKSDINTMQFVAYGSYAISSDMMLDLNVGWATNEYDQRRAAFGNGIALANYNGTQLTAGAELSYSYKINDKLTFIPSLAARFSQVKTDGYTETGAVINNTVMDGNENAVLATAKGAFEWSVGSAGTLLANVGVSSNSSDVASVTTSLSGSGATYVSNGIEQDSTLINAGVGYRYVTSKSLAVTAAYDMESSSGFEASTVSVKVKMPF